MGGFSQIASRYRVASDPLRSERKVELAAVVLAGVLILQILYSVVVLVKGGQPKAILPSSDSLQVGALQRTGLVTIPQSGEVRARPVFWPSRRPVSAEPAVAVKEKPKAAKKSELDSVKLLGVIGSGDSAVVIVLVKGQKKRILLGDMVVGWELQSVERGEAVFSDSGGSQTLLLKQATVAAPAPAPAPSQSKKAAMAEARKSRMSSK